MTKINLADYPMSEGNKLPYICADHPNAQVRHEWEEKYMRIHLTGRETPKRVVNNKYYCNDCGRELAPPKDN